MGGSPGTVWIGGDVVANVNTAQPRKTLGRRELEGRLVPLIADLQACAGCLPSCGSFVQGI